MGGILSSWRKSKTTVEVLEDIDKNILKLEKFRKTNQELRKKVIWNLISTSVITYVIACIALYALFTPNSWTERFLQILPVLCFPIIIYLMKRLLHWWFVRKISKNELQLQELREQRKEILEKVMETETYKKAKEILEKFDPETKKKLEEERQRRENPVVVPQTPGSELRRRNTPVNSPPAMIPGQHSPGMPITTRPLPTPMATPNYAMNGAGRGQRMMPVSLPRPLIQQNRSAVEKFVEYFVGDGPNNKYALICKNCYSHNGMALQEEFEFIAYRCAYCRYFNAARKQRPNAPTLPSLVPQTPVITRNDDDVKQSDADSGQGSSTSQSPKSPEDLDQTVLEADDSEKEATTTIQPKKLQFSSPEAKEEEWDAADEDLHEKEKVNEDEVSEKDLKESAKI